MTEPNNPDLKLIQKAARGDRRAFTSLFNKHFQSVYNYALMLCSDPAQAEDLTQEAFIRAHTNLSRFGPPWNFRAWVFRLTHNYFLDRIRQDRAVDPLEEGEQVRSTNPSPEKETLVREVGERVKNTLNRLRVQYREILVLREINGFSYAEIGEILDITISNVKVLLHRARGAFQEAYGIRLLLEDPSGECQEVAALLPALHDAEALLDQERLAREHLKYCEACQKRRQWLIEQSLVLGALVPVLPPEALAKRILQQTSGARGWKSPQGSGPKIRRILGYGGAAGLLGGAAWFLISLWGGPQPPAALPPAASEDPPAEVIALEEPVPSETAASPPPPPPPAPQGPTPTPTPEPEDLTSLRCDLFQDLDISLILLTIPEETMVLPLYLKMGGGVPCLGVEYPQVAEPCQYGASLGELEAYTCSLQGFEDRLYCLFRMTPDLPGLALDFELRLNQCPDPIYLQSLVTIPEIRLLETTSCTADLNTAKCQAAGGKMSDTKSAAPYCICP